MNKKKQKNYSIFCCYCEEPRKNKPNTQNQRNIIEKSNHSEIYKIDTNSNVSREIIKDERNQDSFTSNTKIKNNSIFNYHINPNSPIKRRGSNDNTNYSMSNININNNILNTDKKSTKTSYNKGIKRLMDMYKNNQQNGINSSLKKKNNLIDLEKISLKKDNTEKNKNDNNINININNEKDILNQDNKSTHIDNNDNKNKDIRNDKNINTNQKKINVLPKIIQYKKGVNEISERKNRTTIYEVEDNISKDQFQQNKSNIIKNNLNKNNFTNIDIINYSNIEHKFNEESKNNDNYNTYSNDKDLIKNKNIINNSIIKYNDNIKDKSINKNSEKNENCINNKINNIRNCVNNNSKIKNENENENESLNKIADSKQEQNNNNTNNIISNILDVNPINEINSGNHMFSNKEENNNVLSDKDVSKINDLNCINDNDNENMNDNDEIKDEESNINSENKGILCSKTMNVKKKENYFLNEFDKDFEAEFDNNSDSPKLNYLTGYYDTVPQENKSILMSEQRPTNTNDNKTTNTNMNKTNQNENEEENVKEELEDEVGSIDEFKNTNDNRSILSSYIFSSVHITESKSIYQSVISKSEYQDAGSNFNDLTPSERGAFNFISPQINRLNSREVEFRIGEDMNFPFAKKDSKASNNIQNINMFLNSQLNYSIKKMKEKIIDKDKEIQRNKYLINHLKQKTNDIEDEKKKYEKWIEEEEKENENLNQFLKYLMEYN